MAKKTSYLFCRYQILVDESPLSASEELSLLVSVLGRPIAYRVREPDPDDFDTYLMKPRSKSMHGYSVHTWEVAQDIKFRERSRYDRTNDDVQNEIVPTDEIRHTKFVAVPLLRVVAVDDSLSERSLGARSAVGRFRGILESHRDDIDVTVSFAGTPQDAQRALETWSLDQFSFTVRPFNPTPRKPGDVMDELMQNDGVGILRAIAKPAGEQDMRDSHAGLIAEARGLTDAGYGQYGATGTTPDGLRASISQPKFSTEKKKNLETAAQNRTLKVYIERSDTAEEEESAVVKALIDLYG